MRFILSLVTAATVMTSAGVVAAPFSSEGSVTLVSDYYFRGISQTEQGPAIQGSVSINHQDGWYASAWGSNIRFGEGSMELDLSLGRNWALDENWGLDMGLVQYRYPEGDNDTTGYNYMEGYAKLNYQDWQLGLALSDSYFGNDVGKFWYLSLDWQQTLTSELQLNWHLGYNQFDNDQEFKTFLGSPVLDDSGYTDWGLTLSTEQLGLTWSVGYVGNSIASDACADICDNRLLLSVAKSF